MQGVFVKSSYISNSIPKWNGCPSSYARFANEGAVYNEAEITIDEK